jgi:hypothetical protein
MGVTISVSRAAALIERRRIVSNWASRQNGQPPAVKTDMHRRAGNGWQTRQNPRTQQ